MTVHCPHCSTGYLLPDHLVGSAGARVSCPNCAGTFVALRDGAPGQGESAAGEPRGATTGVGPEVAEVHAPPAAESPSAVAARVLDALDLALGGALQDASRRGKALSEHGPAIMGAFAEYLRRAGGGGSAAEFRAALRERCGVDLTPRIQG